MGCIVLMIGGIQACNRTLLGAYKKGGRKKDLEDKVEGAIEDQSWGAE